MHHFYETRQRGMDMSEQGGSIVALIQFNPIVGDIEGNAHRLEQLIRTAAASGAVVCVSTELAICGYPPRDLLMQSQFVELSQHAAFALDVEIPSLIGTPTVQIMFEENQETVLPFLEIKHQSRLLPVNNYFQPMTSLMRHVILIPMIGQGLLARFLEPSNLESQFARMHGKWLEKHLRNTMQIRLNNWLSGVDKA